MEAGTGSPASASSVGATSTWLNSASVVRPGFVARGYRTIPGTRIDSSHGTRLSRRP